MNINEQYLLYTFADELINKHHYNLIYANGKTDEIWLEKYEDRTSKVVRLIHKGFDWKNHLKRDISFLFQRVLNAKRMFGKRIEVYNLYFTSHPPVDTWEMLKQPIKSQGKNPMMMHVYYLDENSYPEETERFQNDLLASPIDYNLDVSTEYKEGIVDKAKVDFKTKLSSKNEQIKDIFSYGKPIFSYIFIVINVLIFFLLEMNGGSTSIETLIQFGAKYNVAIIADGEWWRLISSMFLHIGILHLMMNMLAIFYLGIVVEKIYGSSRFLFIYFVAGIGGSIASFAFSTSISAGASGAIFGLFGALLYFGIIHKRLFLQTMGSSILFIIAINLVIGFTIEEIDMAAHIGGLIAGFFASAIVNLPKTKQITKQFIAGVITIVLFIGFTYFGVYANSNNQSYYLLQIQELILEENYLEVIPLATEALSLDGEEDGILLFQRSYAYIELNELDKAIADLEKSVTVGEPMPEAYYNLALLYRSKGELDSAKEAITKAYQMNTSDKKFEELYEDLIGN
ncbi:rhomboid family intramembrane serine protease [Oceanobacillus sp. CAU 1775]